MLMSPYVDGSPYVNISPYVDVSPDVDVCFFNPYTIFIFIFMQAEIPGTGTPMPSLLGAGAQSPKWSKSEAKMKRTAQATAHQLI